MPEEPWTILKILQWTTRYFEEKTVAEPRTSAEVLLAHVLGQDRLYLYLNYDRPLDRHELSAFRRCIKRRLTGEPVHYITGTREFWSLPLNVSPAVLIPRAETEVLVEEVVEFVSQRASTQTELKIMDLGTGSGAIAIALAREFPLARIVAIDLSMAALKLARQNAREHEVEQRIHFLCGDMFAGMLGPGAKFTAVVANPPYVSHAAFPKLPREIRDFEPRRALDGGPQGLAVISGIVRQAPAFLSPSGAVFLEIGAGQADTVSGMVHQSHCYRSYRIRKDYGGIDRVLVAEKAEDAETHKQEIARTRNAGG